MAKYWWHSDQSRRFRQADQGLTQSADAAIILQRLGFFKILSVLKNMFKKQIGAPAVKISVVETLFEKGVNKILLQKKIFSRKNKYKKKKDIPK